MKMPPASHRAWPPPAGRPAMAMVWHDLLFAHWRVPAPDVQRVLPAPLVCDTIDGHAYIAVVPFRMTGVRAWGVPGVPGLSAFPETNVRTYVTVNGKPGVFFFSLDATNRLAVRVARRWFHLRYMDAVMHCRADGEWIDYAARRVHTGEPPASLRLRYRPVGGVFHAAPRTLEHALTERYGMYMVTPNGRVLRGDIHHAPWPLQRAEAHINACTMLDALGLRPDRPPDHLLFARRIDVPAWWPVYAS